MPGRQGERRRFYFKAKPLADGVSVNKSATCSAAKINICVNKSHEGRQQQKIKKKKQREPAKQPQTWPEPEMGAGRRGWPESKHSGSSCAVVSVYITCLDLSTRI